VAEQWYQAVLAVIADGLGVGQAAGTTGVAPNVVQRVPAPTALFKASDGAGESVRTHGPLETAVLAHLCRLTCAKSCPDLSSDQDRQVVVNLGRHHLGAYALDHDVNHLGREAGVAG